MAVRAGVGWSTDTTPEKQRAVGGLLGALIGTMVWVQRKYPKRYPSIWMLDLTAGPGIYPDGMLGSPLLETRHIALPMAQGAPIIFSCCEKNRRTMATLQRTIAMRAPGLPVRFFDNQPDALAEVPSRALGLAYLDPNGWSRRGHGLNLELLKEMGERFPAVDVLLTRECGASLRMQGARHTMHMPTIEDYIAAMGKKKQYIARYATRQSWALVFGSNWVNREERMLRWPGGKLQEVKSEQGQALIRQFLLGRKGEKPWSQGELPWGA